MLKDIIIIIPTHKRQHYLNRVAWYYSHFDMQVYICDSTPGTFFNIDKYDNVNYIWCPEKNFYTKILHVLNTTNADFYATSADDDFLKQETLMECYEAMKKDRNISMSIGGQNLFKEGFASKSFYHLPQANPLSDINPGFTKTDSIFKVWTNFQNVLWSLFTKECLELSMQKLICNHYASQNFIELTLGQVALDQGCVYVASGDLNFREYTEKDHWGKREAIINLSNVIKGKIKFCDTRKYIGKKHMIKHALGLMIYLISNTGFISRRIHKNSADINKMEPFEVQDEIMSKIIDEAISK